MNDDVKKHIASIFRTMILSIMAIGFVFGILATMLFNLIITSIKEQP